MKFQLTTTPINNKWRYQAQFQGANETKRAKDWLASRPSNDFHADQNSIYTNDLQVIFELRVHFDRVIKMIKSSPLQPQP